MNSTLDMVTLIEDSKTNNETLMQLINFFEPKIDKSLYQTSENNREDLKQELLIKFMLAVRNYDVESVPGFWEFKNQMKNKLENM